MNFDNSTVSILLGALFGIIYIGVFVKIAMKLRRGGGSLTSVVMGATDAFLNNDQKKAVETIVEKHANKKQQEQTSAEPKSREAEKRKNGRK